MSKDLSKLIVEVKRSGQIYDKKTHRLLLAVITYVSPLHFTATDQERNQNVFNRDGSGCRAMGDGSKRFEPL